jgi:hypothetical protein
MNPLNVSRFTRMTPASVNRTTSSRFLASASQIRDLLPTNQWKLSGALSFDKDGQEKKWPALSRKEILPDSLYGPLRQDFRSLRKAMRQERRLQLGDKVTLSFENHDTIWLQIQEMLAIEGGGSEQVTDELLAYTDLLPTSSQVCATLMLAEPNVAKRVAFLTQCVGIEHCFTLQWSNAQGAAGSVTAAPLEEEGIDRTRKGEDTKTSAVHFLVFQFASDESASFAGAVEAFIHCEHGSYGTHTVPVTGKLLESLQKDMLCRM